MQKAEPHVSCLCVTEDRHAFIPWLLWNWRKQHWAKKDLLIIDSSSEPIAVPDRDDIRVVRATPGATVGHKRNLALDHASGDAIAWFDDDDWQHPERLTRLVQALRSGHRYGGQTQGWFVDLEHGRCSNYRGSRILFNSAVFETELARSVRFDENVARASDTRWLRALAARHRDNGRRVGGESLFAWLSHERNLSNPVSKRRFRQPLTDFQARVGAAWGDTTQELDALRGRLRGEKEDSKERSRDRRQHTPISAIVKATILDAAYLGTTVPHLLRQAGVDFDERLVVVDPRPEFEGKYTHRSKSSRAHLDAVLEELVSRGEIDRVVMVDPEQRQAVMRDYFGRDAERVPTHAVTGGPIYPTLFGLEAARNDYVVQFDADMLFHASGGSWVEQALGHLDDDPTLWLMMTHGGPPAGPVDQKRSLGPTNARRAKWDDNRRIWRFQTASTRYFLCDRRRLRGKLRFCAQGGGCAPLEQCISDALQRHGASRGCVAFDGSWDLHPHSHEEPFPSRAGELVAAVEAGEVPPSQRGRYDMRLDIPQHRRAWERQLLAGAAKPQDEPDKVSAAPRDPATPAVAPISIVIPVRDRAGDRLRNSLASLGWQSVGRPWQVTVVSHGSRPEIDRDLERLCAEAGAELLRVSSPDQPWCKPHALNVGLRATDPAMAFVMTMDADMILAPDFLATVLAILREDPRRLALCRSSDLPQNAAVPATGISAEAFPALARRARLRGKHGSGGIQAARRDFFFDVRGYDEDMIWWGAEDNDLLQRAVASGLTPTWICEQTKMLHQWHPKTHRALTDPKLRREAQRAWTRNHELMKQKANQPRRNPNGWGGVMGND